MDVARSARLVVLSCRKCGERTTSTPDEVEAMIAYHKARHAKVDPHVTPEDFQPVLGWEEGDG